jgi:hypothetical protein
VIKINLLPRHILESRRVKALLRLIVAVLVLETAAFAAYIWAPAPFSVSSRMRQAKQRRAKAVQQADAVRELESQVEGVRARYGEKAGWVNWVEEADELPQAWIDYYTAVIGTVPADVVVRALPTPSGGVITLSGATSDLMAAARWYLNTLRCEIVQASQDAVSFSTATVGYPGELTPGDNPKMQQTVTMRMVLRPEVYSRMLTLPAPPASAGVGGVPGGVAGGRMGMPGRTGGRGERGARAGERMSMREGGMRDR